MKIKIICFILVALTMLASTAYTPKVDPPKEDRLTQLEKRVTTLEEWTVRVGGKIK